MSLYIVLKIFRNASPSSLWFHWLGVLQKLNSAQYALSLWHGTGWLADPENLENPENPENGVSDPENLENPENRQK